jgi:hypothetical protein
MSGKCVACKNEGFLTLDIVSGYSFCDAHYHELKIRSKQLAEDNLEDMPVLFWFQSIGELLQVEWEKSDQLKETKDEPENFSGWSGCELV